MNRKLSIMWGICFSILFTAGLVSAAVGVGAPNVVVMMVDDMGFAGPSIAPYGNPHYKTPGRDRLAREGLLFTEGTKPDTGLPAP